MKRFARALAVTLGLALIGSLVSLVPQKNVTAQGGPTVTIASPLPLPVKGNVNASVNGTVSAQQSGPWNVGLTGTPNVSITNTPMVSLAAGTGVSVTNPVDPSNNPTPLATLDASQPYEDICFASTPGLIPNQLRCSFRAVPAGKRLVVQEVDMLIIVNSGLQPNEISVGTGVSHFFPATKISSDPSQNRDTFAVHQETRLYVGLNQEPPECFVGFTNVASAGSLTCSLSGFLVDVPVL